MTSEMLQNLAVKCGGDVATVTEIVEKLRAKSVVRKLRKPKPAATMPSVDLTADALDEDSTADGLPSGGGSKNPFAKSNVQI